MSEAAAEFDHREFNCVGEEPGEGDGDDHGEEGAEEGGG